jgi:hypothetical protein
VLRKADLEFVEVKEVPRTGVLVELAMGVFQPWRAFEGLFGVGMLEDAAGRWVDGVTGRVREHGEGGVDEWKAPKFRIRGIRSGCQLKA